MPAVYPFSSIEFAAGMGRDLSWLIAPPYDVLDASGKQRLLSRDARNIVSVDLPHTPAKELGPAEAYRAAGERFRGMLREGTLAYRERPVVYAYRQTWTQPDAGNPSRMVTFKRTGMACCVDTVPFGARTGGGILPHEETFSGPKQDRLALMRATGAQLSPIFGLHADTRGAVRDVLSQVTSSHAADRMGRTEDGTLHEVWVIEDEATIDAYTAALGGEDVFIADGHHRYNTGLNYLRELEASGPVGSDHPARRTMMVLIGMSDPGLVIWPTHRVLGGMKDYTLERFKEAARGLVTMREVPGDLRTLGHALGMLPKNDGLSVGIWDFASNRGMIASPIGTDPLSARFASKPAAWRNLAVAYCQHVIVEEICQPKLNAGQGVKWAFPHTLDEVLQIGSGAETGAGGGKVFGETGAQMAVIVRPTPLEAVREVSCAGELMPQKSTFFYPKLATGLFMHG